MNVNELIEAVDDLSEADLEHLVERARLTLGSSASRSLMVKRRYILTDY